MTSAQIIGVVVGGVLVFAAGVATGAVLCLSAIGRACASAGL